MPTSAETAIKNLSRQPGNTTCPNCGTYSKYGFSTICIKYYTFVCNNCKSSHQAISHRCKSVTMSSWEMGEVLKLKRYGNDYARKVWLGSAPEVGEGGRPKEGSDINVFKRFIVEVYENKRYYKEPLEEEEGGKVVTANTNGVNAAATVAPVSAPVSRYGQRPHQQQQPQQLRKPANAALVNGYTQPQNWGKLQRPPPTNNRTSSSGIAPPPSSAPVPAATAPEVDLLDFGAFDSALPTTTTSKQQQQPAPFDPFNITPSTTATSTSTTTATSSSSTTTPAPISTGSNSNNANNDPFFGTQEPSVASPNTNMKNGFDPFGVSVMTPPSTTSVVSAPPLSSSSSVVLGGDDGSVVGVGKKPVMNNSGSGGANNVSNGFMNGSMNGNSNMMMGNNSNMMMGNSMNGGNNSMMMMNNTTLMNNTNGTTNNMMMNGMNGMMMNQQQQQSSAAMAMNMNVMQPMNNSIGNNFGGGGGMMGMSASTGGGSVVAGGGGGGGKGGVSNQKADPFAGLGF